MSKRTYYVCDTCGEERDQMYISSQWMFACLDRPIFKATITMDDGQDICAGCAREFLATPERWFVIKRMDLDDD